MIKKEELKVFKILMQYSSWFLIAVLVVVVALLYKQQTSSPEDRFLQCLEKWDILLGVLPNCANCTQERLLLKDFSSDTRLGQFMCTYDGTLDPCYNTTLLPVFIAAANNSSYKYVGEGYKNLSEIMAMLNCTQ